MTGNINIALLSEDGVREVSSVRQFSVATPLYPNEGTQAARFLRALLRGGRIDPLRGWIQLGIYRLSDTKLQLKRLGWPVEKLMKQVSNRFGEACRVAEYFLPADAIEHAGTRGKLFTEGGA